MDATEARLVKLEGQMNALAQAWLYLAAAVEMHGANLEPMKAALCRKRWPGRPEIEAEAQDSLRWLCRELTAARNVREARFRDLQGPWH